jgi:ACS family glucarate transporter-like MFS transporter
MLQSSAPREQIGLWTGIYNFIGNIAGAVSPIITGILIQRTGSYVAPFMLAAIVIAAGPIALWMVRLPAAQEQT